MEFTICNLCGANQPRRLFRKFERDVSQCRNCGLVYAGPQRLTREETWDRYNPNYFQQEYLPSLGVINGKIDYDALTGRFARAIHHIRPFRKLGTLLEIGCGAGLFLKIAERDGWQVMGTEVMEAGIEFARTQLQIPILQGVIEDLTLPTAAYDVVALFDVIEHLSDPYTTLKQILQLLRPGGWLMISTPNINSLSRRALGASWAVINPGEHLYYFSQDSLGQMLRRSGYGVVWFDLQYAPQGLYETMFPRHNHAPNSLRAQAYTWFVDHYGRRLLDQIQSRGLADELWCLAQRPDESNT